MNCVLLIGGEFAIDDFLRSVTAVKTGDDTTPNEIVSQYRLSKVKSSMRRTATPAYILFSSRQNAVSTSR